MGQELDFGVAVLGIDGRPDRGAYVEHVALDFEGQLRGGDHAPRDDLDFGRIDRCRQDGDEFVAADARQRIDGAQHFLETHGRHAQERIADRVAQRIVDLLEAVEVERQHGEAGAGALRLGNRHAQAIGQERAVGQAGEVVVRRHVTQPLFGGMLLRDVVHHDEKFEMVVLAGAGGDLPFAPQRPLGHVQPRLQARLAGRIARVVHDGFESRPVFHVDAGRQCRAVRDGFADHGLGALAGIKNPPRAIGAQDQIPSRFHQAFKRELGCKLLLIHPFRKHSGEFVGLC